MPGTFTNINCEMKSMAVYSALFAMTIHCTVDSNESSFSTYICKSQFENQLNAAHIGSHDVFTIIHNLHMTHGNIKLDQDYDDDEICCAQNEINSECVEEYAFPTICSLELDSPI